MLPAEEEFFAAVCFFLTPRRVLATLFLPILSSCLSCRPPPERRLSVQRCRRQWRAMQVLVRPELQSELLSIVFQKALKYAYNCRARFVFRRRYANTVHARPRPAESLMRQQSSAMVTAVSCARLRSERVWQSPLLSPVLSTAVSNVVTRYYGRHYIEGGIRQVRGARRVGAVCRNAAS